VRVLIRGGRVIDPSRGLDAVRDVAIDGGIIRAISEHIEERGHEIIDATNCVVAPGLIDMHVHLREPGQTHKETIATGTAAAVAGGFTAVACMPNTTPSIDTPAVIAEIAQRVTQAGLARVYPIAAITHERKGEQLAPYHELALAGAVAFSDDGSTVENVRVLRNAALYARDVKGPFISHCMDNALHGDAVMNEGLHSAVLGLAGSPRLAEDVIVARDVLVAADTRKAWHIAHVSTGTSLDIIRWARSRGTAVTCEVTPHHLLLHDDLFVDYHARAKVAPPLREAEDSAALRAAVRDGTIDVFATDHAPHTMEEKAQLLSIAPVGFSGLEIAVGAYAHALPDLPLDRFITLLSTRPAQILGVEGGTLAVGARADVTIFGERPWTVDARSFYSKGKNTPFDGFTFARRVVATVVGGRLAYQAERGVLEPLAYT
jgi:dihydroorotase